MHIYLGSIILRLWTTFSYTFFFLVQAIGPTLQCYIGPTAAIPFWILKRFSLFTLTKLSPFHPTVAFYVKSHIQHRIDSRLACYFSDPTAFRAVMRLSAAVISGSTALNLIVGTSQWTSKDLDIYTRRGESKAIIAFLLREGYVCFRPHFRNPETVLSQSWPYQNMIDDQLIYRILQFRKPMITGSYLTIDLIESSTDSSVSPIPEFHCTLVMNYISADAVLCMYPRLTSEGIAIKQDRHAKDREVWIKKYTSRGFRILDSIATLGYPCGSACPTVIRTLGDPESLYFVFDQRERTAVPFPGLEEPCDFGWPTLYWYLGRSNLVYARLCPNPLCTSDIYDPLRTVWPEPFACITRDNVD